MLFDFSIPDIFTVFYGIAQSFFSFQNVMGSFVASESEIIEFHAIWLCHELL